MSSLIVDITLANCNLWSVPPTKPQLAQPPGLMMSETKANIFSSSPHWRTRNWRTTWCNSHSLDSLLDWGKCANPGANSSFLPSGKSFQRVSLVESHTTIVPTCAVFISLLPLIIVNHRHDSDQHLSLSPPKKQKNKKNSYPGDPPSAQSAPASPLQPCFQACSAPKARECSRGRENGANGANGAKPH